MQVTLTGFKALSGSTKEELIVGEEARDRSDPLRLLMGRRARINDSSGNTRTTTRSPMIRCPMIVPLEKASEWGLGLALE